MYGLRRIIQIDSFIRGVRTVVDVDEHAIINGTNGAGKSSVLRLIPFFYGRDASQLDKNMAGRDSFVEFYLPRPTSLIIFEYGRESGTCCVVVSRHKSADKQVYRFLSGSFSEERFAQPGPDGQLRYLKGYELKRHWDTLGLTYSSQIEIVSDYRGIIQNDTTLLNRSGDGRRLRALARAYCLGSARTHMRHIELVCSAIASRQGNMRRMKDLLADIMVSDGLQFPEPPLHHMDVDLPREIQSLRDFEAEVPRMREALQQHYDLMALQTQLLSSHHQLRQAKDRLSDEIGEQEKQRAELEGKIAETQADWDEEEQKLISSRNEAKGDVEDLEQKIQRLEDRYRDYDERNLDQLADDYARMADHEEVLRQAIERYDRLTEGVKQEEATKQQHLNEAYQRYERQRGRLQKTLDEARAELDRQRAQQQRDIEKLQTTQAEEREALQSRQQSEERALYERKVMVEATAQNAAPTEVEQRDLAELRERAKKLRHDVGQQQSQFEQAEANWGAAQKEVDGMLKQLSQRKRQVREEEERLEAIHKLLYAEKGTWLSALREKDPDWSRRLGRVIDPGLLQRKDLAPHYEESSESLCGWDLNWSVIDAPEHARSEEQLQVDYQAQEERIELAQKQVVEAESAASKAKAATKEAETQFHEARQQYQQARRNHIQTLEALEQQDRLVLEAVEDRRREALKEVKRLASELGEMARRHRQEQEQLAARQREASMELKSVIATALSGYEAAVAAGEQALDDAAKAHKSACKAIEEDYRSACSQQGVDEQSLKDAQAAVNRSKAHIEKLREQAEAVREYKTWLENDWPKRRGFSEQLREAHRQCDAAEQKLEQARKQYKEQQRAMTSQRKRLNDQIAKQRHVLNDISELLKELGTFPRTTDAAETPSDDMPIQQLIETTRGLLDDYKQLRNSLLPRMSEINSRISSFEGTQLAKAWSRAKAEVARHSGIEDEHDERFKLNMPQALEVFLDQEIESIKEARIEALRIAGKGLIDYFENLRRIHQGIEGQARRITRAIEQHMQIEALSDISVVMSSRVDAVEYWNTLQSFVGHWEAWRNNEDEVFPDGLFLEEFAQLVKELGVLSQSGKRRLRDYFDLKIHLVENGHRRKIENDAQLDASTSEGLKYLAVCMIYIGISRLLCEDRSVNLHWPIDELGILHRDNVGRLFSMLDQGGIVMVGGFPTEEAEMLRHFSRRHVIDFRHGIRVIDVAKESLREHALKLRQGGVQ